MARGIGVANPADVSVDEPATLDRLFDAPPATFSPTPFWWWGGERLDADRLRWQLDRLVEGGVRNVIVIHLAPSGPMHGSPPDDPQWFSDEWWTQFRQMCDHARRVGVGVWFYDQIGAAGGNMPGQLSTIDPDLVGWFLDRVVVETDGSATITCPDGGEPVAGAALALDGDGRVSAVTAVPIEGRELRWTGHGRHRVMLAYARRQGYDCLSARGGAALIDAIHGEFERRLPEYLGDPIRGSWQDEMLRFGTWTRGFDDDFHAQHGYRLADHISALWEGDDETSRKVRTDYHATRTARAEASFFRPLHEWHERHGMLMGCDQQRPARAGHPLAAAQLYGEYMATHRWLSAPGSDQAGDGNVHSSMAHLYERPRASVLAFHTSGWGGTLEETFDWLVPWLRAGINLYVPHAVYYSTRGGWYEWAAPSTCWRQPYWRHYPVFATAVSRLCAVLSQGTHCCDVAVLYPSTTIHAHLPVDEPIRQLVLPGPDPSPLMQPALEAQDVYLRLVGRMDWKNAAPGLLDRDRRDFDVIDEASVQRATCVDGELRVAGEAYKVVVLPSCRVIEAGTAAALVRFVDSGGHVVVVGAPPEFAAGRDGDDTAVRALTDLVRSGAVRHVDDADDVGVALAPVDRRVDAPVPTLLRRVGDRHVLFVPAAHPSATVVHYGDEMEAADYDFDPGRYAAQMRITVRDVAGSPAVWDVFTGERRELPVTSRDARTTEVTVPLDGAPSALIVWENDT